MAEHPLTEPFETTGDWYLPEEPERVIAGSLRYTPDRTELQLHESFRPLRGTIRFGDVKQPYPAIHGTSREGEAITVLEAQRMGFSWHFRPGVFRQPEKVICSWLLIGAHLPPDFAYPMVRFRVPGLQVWLSRPTIDQSQNRDGETGGLISVYRVQELAKETTPVPSIETNVEWTTASSSKADSFTAISVTVSGWIAIKPAQPKPIAWFIDQEHQISTMLAFLAGTPMSPDCIEASIDGEPHYTVSVMVALRDAKQCRHTNPREFFMPRNSMDVHLPDVVRAWLDVYPKIATPSALALSVLASESLWLHVKFLSLIQGLEGFHRALPDGNYMTKEDYRSVGKVLGDAIPSDLNPDHKDALRSRIKYGYQYSLQERLDGLAGRLSEPLRQTILGGDGKVPRPWIDTRNYYTHWDEELRPNVLDGQEMYHANVRMEHFLRALYLDLMGVPQEAILNAVSNASRPSQRLVQLNILDRRRKDPNDMSGAFMSITEQDAPNPPGHDLTQP